MGCSSSVPDPNEMYANGSPYDKKCDPGNTNNNTCNPAIRTPTTPNGTTHPSDRCREVTWVANTEEDSSNVILKGDLMQRSHAKQQRGKRLQERAKRREKEAQVMSDRVMEDKEMLSLVSSRSRATSRTGSPKNVKVHLASGVTSPSDMKPEPLAADSSSSDPAETPAAPTEMPPAAPPGDEQPQHESGPLPVPEEEEGLPSRSAPSESQL